MNYEKNIKILTDFEKVLGNGQPVNFKIENSDGELKKVSKEEFANWMAEGKEEKNVKTPPKESLVYGASGDIDGTTVFAERKGKDGFFKESYYEPRSEEEKKQIIERNRKRREQEKTQETKKIEDIDLIELAKEISQEKFQTEVSPNFSKRDQEPKKETNQQSSLQTNKDNKQNIYYGVGLVSLVLLMISLVVVMMKKRR